MTGLEQANMASPSLDIGGSDEARARMSSDIPVVIGPEFSVGNVNNALTGVLGTSSELSLLSLGLMDRARDVEGPKARAEVMVREKRVAPPHPI